MRIRYVVCSEETYGRGEYCPGAECARGEPGSRGGFIVGAAVDLGSEVQGTVCLDAVSYRDYGGLLVISRGYEIRG